MNSKSVGFLLIGLTLIFSACGGGEEEQSEEPKVEVNLPYEEGGAKTAEVFYFGVLEDIVLVDEKIRTVQDLDLQDASVDSINTEIDSMLLFIEQGQMAVNLYADKNWKKVDSMIDLTNEWFDGAKVLADDYFTELAEPMSRPDDTWTDEEKEIYKQYEEEIYSFYAIDEKWVIFQAEFAAANDFDLTSNEEDVVSEEEPADSLTE